MGEIVIGKCAKCNADITMGDLKGRTDCAYCGQPYDSRLLALAAGGANKSEAYASKPMQAGAYAEMPAQGGAYAAMPAHADAFKSSAVNTGAYANMAAQESAYADGQAQTGTYATMPVHTAQNTKSEETTTQKKQSEKATNFDNAIPKFKPDRDAILTASAVNEEIQNHKKKVTMAIAGIAVLLLVGIGTVLAMTSLGTTGQRNEDSITVLNDDKVVDDSEVKVPLSAEPSDLSQDERDAIQCAQASLSYLPYSKAALIRELTNEYNGYSENVATSAVQYMEDAGLVIWKDEAAEWALVLLDGGGFSSREIHNMLTTEYNGYTDDEADYAINYIEDNNLVDWNEQAKSSAELYIEAGVVLDREEMINQLVTQNYFTEEQATYAADQLGL